MNLTLKKIIMILDKKQIDFKEKAWSEIKSLEQEYKRGETKIKDLREMQGEISARIQILLYKLQK